MQRYALAIVFGPTLFQTDGQDNSAGRAIEDLIEHYTDIFEVRPRGILGTDDVRQQQRS